MAERSNAAVLKTVDGQLSGGSNPSLSAKLLGSTVSTPQHLIEEMKKPSGSREGVARRSAEAPEGKRQNPSRVGKVPMITRLRVQPLTPVLRQKELYEHTLKRVRAFF